MKRLLVLTMLFFSIIGYQRSNAQVKINLNLGSQPAWGPEGYDYVDYYYMPDMDVYYNVPKKQFIYMEGNKWAFANSLPARYNNYNIYNSYKVVVNEPNPYLHPDVYRVKYAKYKGGKGPKQIVIRDSHDQRYKNNGREDNDHKDNGNGKNKGKGPKQIIIRDSHDQRYKNNGREDNDHQDNGNGKNKGKGKGNGKGHGKD